jgi:hypothetical protein
MDEQTGSRGRDRREVQGELAELHASLDEACRRYEAWPAKVAAAVYAALDFAEADPRRALELLARDGESGGPGFGQTVDSLNYALEQTVPLAASAMRDSSGPVQGIAMIVSDHLRSGRVEELVRIGPSLVQFALQPYLGYAEAKHWAGRHMRSDGE